ncbi:MAG: hypothetical protein WAN36_06540, partial [Calditrichia bacterium]
MKTKTITGFLFFFSLMLTTLLQPASADQHDEDRLISRVDSSLKVLVDLQNSISGIHPLLNHSYPIAIAEGGLLYIYDFDSAAAEYAF